MEGKLRLHEQVGRAALPRPALAQQAAIAVVTQVGRAAAAGAVLVARLKERDAIDAIVRRIKGSAGRRRPAAPLRSNGDGVTVNPLLSSGLNTFYTG